MRTKGAKDKTPRTRKASGKPKPVTLYLRVPVAVNLALTASAKARGVSVNKLSAEILRNGLDTIVGGYE
jgi:predicted HicB family RNase H-like nuclease